MWICLVDCYNFVDTMTFIVCCMCPSCVEMDSTKYILKYLTVRFFQVLKNPCSISTIKVYFVEIKHAAWQILTSLVDLFFTNRRLHLGIFPIFIVFNFSLECLSRVVSTISLLCGFFVPIWWVSGFSWHQYFIVWVRLCIHHWTIYTWQEWYGA